MSARKTLLLQPPFLRTFGSHNDRMPLELCYASAELTRRSHDNVILNADWTGATRYVRWATLFENFSYFRDAVNGRSPLISETVERVLSFDVDVVVLAAGDNTLAWVDVGNAYLAATISKELRRRGIYTVGVGPFYSAVPERFIEDFDSLIRGYAWLAIGDIVEHLPRHRVLTAAGDPTAPRIRPSTAVLPGCIDDVVLTALGCPYRCSFCFARTLPFTRLPIETVVSDLEARESQDIDIGDAVFSLDKARARDLLPHFRRVEKRLGCEIHANNIDEHWMQLLVECGVERVKMGLEVGDDHALKRLEKTQSIEQVRGAARLAKAFGLKLSIYVLLGGPGFKLEDALRTYDICCELNADDYVINTCAYYDLPNRDFRFDCHFSQELVEEWGLAPVLDQFFSLQNPVKHGLARLL